MPGMVTDNALRRRALVAGLCATAWAGPAQAAPDRVNCSDDRGETTASLTKSSEGMKRRTAEVRYKTSFFEAAFLRKGLRTCALMTLLRHGPDVLDDYPKASGVRVVFFAPDFKEDKYGNVASSGTVTLVRVEISKKTLRRVNVERMLRKIDYFDVVGFRRSVEKLLRRRYYSKHTR